MSFCFVLVERRNAKPLIDVSAHCCLVFIFHVFSAGRRETLDKSQRTDGESTATGSSTPSAGSSSSLSSVGPEPPTGHDHSSSASHNLAGCSTASISAANSTSSRSDLSPGPPSAHSPTYAQQPLALTTSNTRISSETNFANPARKETFPINHTRQQPSLPGPYVKF